MKYQNKYSHFSKLALPPLVGAASKEVPRTVNTLIASSHCTVQRIFPKKKGSHYIFKEGNIRHTMLFKKTNKINIRNTLTVLPE